MSGWNQNNDQSGWYGGGGWNNESGGYEIPEMEEDYQQKPQQQQQQQQNFNFYAGNERKSSQTYYGGNVFYPQPTSSPSSFGGSPSSAEPSDFVGDEPPLLEELGINFDHIRQKTLAVLNPLRSPDSSVINDSDLAGPLVFCLLFGASLLLHGKVQFGYIYGIGVLGCLGIYALLNLMSANGITITCTMSVLGYCLLPMALLSLLSAVLSLTYVYFLQYVDSLL